MFISDEIEVPLTGSVIDHYESLGYTIPREKVKGRNRWVVPKGTKIAVKISDLPKGSNVMIPCKCDYCGFVFERNYISILRGRAQGVSKDACGDPECSDKRRKDTLVEKYGTSDWVEVHQQTGSHLGRHLKYDLQYYIDAFAKLDRDICVGMIADPSHVLSKDKLPFICRNHPDVGVQYASYDSVKKKGKYCCPIGAWGAAANKTRVADIDTVKLICKQRGYTLLTESIKAVDDRIEYVCNSHKEYGVQTTTLYGMTHSDDNCRLCVANRVNGENHWNWRGGINDENDAIRKSWQYKQWRQSVYERDDFICQKCGCRGVLNAHHILNFSNHEDLRFDVSNGITLCKKCHKAFHARYGVCNNTKEQLKEYLSG